jgi:hypothetical protein
MKTLMNVLVLLTLVACSQQPGTSTTSEDVNPTPSLPTRIPDANYIFKSFDQTFSFGLQTQMLGKPMFKHETVVSELTKTVYVAGFTSTGYGEQHHACYWENDSIVILDNENYSEANAIFVDDNAVYVAGNSEGAAIWINGQKTVLDVNGRAFGLAVDGNDVYVAGYVTEEGVNKAVYWKNGQLNYLETTASDATSIRVYDDNVYVTGRTDGSVAYWKNGERTDFNAGGQAYSLAVVDGSVYVAGCVEGGYFSQDRQYISVYWKDGEISQLLNSEVYGDNERLSCAYAVAVMGESIAIGGYSGDNGVRSASVWGKTLISSLEVSSTITGLQVVGTDIIASGYLSADPETTDNHAAAVWFNGVKKNLTEADVWADAYAIYVK